MHTRSFPRPLRLVGVAVAATLLIASCGDSDDEDSSSAPTESAPSSVDESTAPSAVSTVPPFALIALVAAAIDGTPM